MFVRLTTETLTGIPSIVYGLFLQESKYWEKFTEKEIIPQNNGYAAPSIPSVHIIAKKELWQTKH
ncbi:MAG: hypothetical protein KBT11_07535 [Treponema sp.]|nr:hypothetical protein [Candidatus Treponema equifaecale]